jgi:uncharacterized protein YlzI (FlbEa/FlbD family)
MGWGTTFKADIYLNRQSYQNKLQVEAAIDEQEEEIENCTKQLLMYAMAVPSDIIPPDWKEDAVMFVKEKVSEVIENMMEAKQSLVDPNHYLETFDENKGEVD